jgi:hypothetical protein
MYPKGHNPSHGFAARCSSSAAWGIQGSFRVAYGAAYIMQPEYTFVIQAKHRNHTAQASAIRHKLAQAVSRDDTDVRCMRLTYQRPQRLISLVHDLRSLLSSWWLDYAQIVADVVASNVGFVKSLSAPSKGPFAVCGDTGQQLLSEVLAALPPVCPFKPNNTSNAAGESVSTQCAAGSVKHAALERVLLYAHNTTRHLHGQFQKPLCIRPLSVRSSALLLQTSIFACHVASA